MPLDLNAQVTAVDRKNGLSSYTACPRFQTGAAFLWYVYGCSLKYEPFHFESGSNTMSDVLAHQLALYMLQVRLAYYVEEHRFRRGDLICKQGEAATALYVLLSGECRAYVQVVITPLNGTSRCDNRIAISLSCQYHALIDSAPCGLVPQRAACLCLSQRTHLISCTSSHNHRATLSVALVQELPHHAGQLNRSLRSRGTRRPEPMMTGGTCHCCNRQATLALWCPLRSSSDCSHNCAAQHTALPLHPNRPMGSTIHTCGAPLNNTARVLCQLPAQQLNITVSTAAQQPLLRQTLLFHWDQLRLACWGVVSCWDSRC